jgi:hypothetical protein
MFYIFRSYAVREKIPKIRGGVLSTPPLIFGFLLCNCVTPNIVKRFTPTISNILENRNLYGRIFLFNETNLTFGETKMADKGQKIISRRDAMKILAAAAGATALANLPEKWDTPDLEVGVLPAHAQTSGGIYTLAAGQSDPNANFCFSLVSTAVISPVATGIPLRYVITLSPGLAITSPAASTGTVPTDGSGTASLSIDVDINTFNVGSTVSVTWSFENPSDGTNSGIQVFTSAGGGC